MLSKTLVISSLALFLLASCSGRRFEYVRSTASTEVGASSLPEAKGPLFGGGIKIEGTGSFSVPPSEAIIARIQNGLDNNVKVSAGNFANAYNQVKKNLPQTTDPTKATGFDQVQLLVYGACSDLTSGAAPLMKSKYNVDPAASVTANKNALITAGMQMLDRHTAGLASASIATTKIREALTELTTDLSAIGSNTSIIAFMSVCIAANTTGASLLGF